MKATVWPLFLLLTSALHAQTEPPPRPLVPVDAASMPRPAESISLGNLMVPPKAVRELQRSQAALQSGDLRSSAEHLEKALQIYPRSLEAHNNLGSRYVALHEYEKAAAEFQKAVDLDPRVKEPFNNLSVAYFLLRRYPDAERAARRALAINPRDSTPRYMLGCILATDKRNPEEAMELLRQTATEFPDARLLLAQTLIRLGKAQEAERELREYLNIPGAEKKQKVECWLPRLTQSSISTGCPRQASAP
jgi:tetratricopeptide (TPR) repeat protein